MEWRWYWTPLGLCSLGLYFQRQGTRLDVLGGRRIAEAFWALALVFLLVSWLRWRRSVR
jgi:hypothetical protein